MVVEIFVRLCGLVHLAELGLSQRKSVRAFEFGLCTHTHPLAL